MYYTYFRRMKRLFTIFTTIILFTVLSGCNTPTGDTSKNKSPQSASATIEFRQDEFDFGEIEKGRVVECKFSFKNTGENEVLISNVETECGCTAAYWPKQPLSSGEQSTIAVSLDKKTGGTVRQTVKVFGNFTGSPKILVVKAKVK